MRLARSSAALAAALIAAACSSSSSQSGPLTVPASPLPVPWHGQVEASPSLANHLLHASDFGQGWYQGFDPLFPTLPGVLPPGARDGAMTMVDKAHRTSTMWVSDAQIWERAVDFKSVAAARAYLATLVPTNSTTAAPPSKQNQRLGFLVGKRAYTVLTEYFHHPAPGHSVFYRNSAAAKRAFDAAKKRARTGA